MLYEKSWKTFKIHSIRIPFDESISKYPFLAQSLGLKTDIIHCSGIESGLLKLCKCSEKLIAEEKATSENV